MSGGKGRQRRWERQERPKGDWWPDLGLRGFVAMYSGILLLILSGVVVGILLRASTIDSILRVACSADGCSEVLLVALGWCLVGLPVIALWAIYSFVRPSPGGLWLLVLGVALLAAGSATVITGRGEPAQTMAELQALNPAISTLLLGTFVALAAFPLGAIVGAYVSSTARRRRRKGASRVRRLIVGHSDKLPLTGAAALEVMALITLLCVAAAGASG